ncbi:hypothetical protein ACFPJ1_40580 [Kribbella qitaiheensis]|uniref:hypothetical protein n=1 Tax=Kribbella qitaiheensis TaxID=1544730 RepID=UPI003617C485
MTTDDMTTPAGPTGRDKRYEICGGKKRQGEGDCTRPAGWGTDHPGLGKCKLHGGSTQNHKTAAVATQARRDVVLFGGRRDIHPADALLELVHWTAGEVDYWRHRVQLLEEHELTWGVTRIKDGGQDTGTTEEAKPNIAYVMLVDASNRLEKYSTAALKAGVDERRVRLAEQQGTLLHGILVAVLGELGHDVAPGSVAAQVVLRHMAPVVAAMAELETGGAA